MLTGPQVIVVATPVFLALIGLEAWLAHRRGLQVYRLKNYGGILIIWDRLFGSFAEEHDAEPCVYGTRSPLRSWNPVRANFQVYRQLFDDSRRATRWSDKLRLWLEPPGWRPADVAARFPRLAFDLAAVQRFDPPLPRARARVALVLFMAVLFATTLLLWNAQAWPLPAALALASAIVLALWVLGRVTMAAPR